MGNQSKIADKNLLRDIEEKYKFIIDKDKFISEIVPSDNELIFTKGEPNKRDYTIEVKYKDLTPIKIYVKPFTGRVTFY